MTHTATHQDPALKDEEANEGHSALFGLAIAGALAAGLGLFLRSEKGHELRDDLKDKAKDLAERFQQKREDLQEKVSNVFGELTDDLETSYLEVQGKVLADVHSLKKGADLTKEKFDQMVDKAVEEYSKQRQWSEGVTKELKTNLKQDWKEIKAL
jgi:gas vesicle protein